MKNNTYFYVKTLRELQTHRDDLQSLTHSKNAVSSYSTSVCSLNKNAEAPVGGFCIVLLQSLTAT